MAIFSNEEVHTVQGEITLVLTVEYNPAFKDHVVRLYDAGQDGGPVTSGSLPFTWSTADLYATLERLAQFAKIDAQNKEAKP